MCTRAPWAIPHDSTCDIILLIFYGNLQANAGMTTVRGESGSRILVIRVVVGGLVAKSCLTLCDPMDCSLPGSSASGILQPRILEWVAISFSRGSFQPMNQTQVSCIVGRFFTNWAMREIIWEQVQLFSLCKQRSLSFYVDHFKSLLNLLQYCFCFMFFCHKACVILVPQPRIELAPPVLEGRFLTTRLPGKSQEDHFKILFAVWPLLSLSPPLSLSLPLSHPFFFSSIFHFSSFIMLVALPFWHSS